MGSRTGGLFGGGFIPTVGKVGSVATISRRFVDKYLWCTTAKSGCLLVGSCTPTPVLVSRSVI